MVLQFEINNQAFLQMGGLFVVYFVVLWTLSYVMKYARQ